ncbi:NfeD family protein [Microbacterium sp. LRZ72]|uniref:NfeD family protein n=1 Tax=Microbacterium sp. LRZ72 TaxID=2942481 RepID=UPI0029A45C7C|nr:NfeD family protein [Microbacterium sp. LRZ72]MDX2375315.1 NfeD family protein [Microbacterium sp. LRZ72]
MDVVQTIEQFAWIGWIVLILVFVTIEALTLELTFLMLGLGGAAGLIAGLLGAPLWLQVVVAAVVAALLLLFLRPRLLNRLRQGEDPTPSNVDALMGMPGAVVSVRTATDGQVRLSNGETWTARGDPAAPPLVPGMTVVVVRIDGATALIRPTLEENAP